MLIQDRVMPDRRIVHLLLNGLAKVGDSESAFRVYNKMLNLGITPIMSTYSRLFRTCAEDISAWQRKHRYTLENITGEPDICSEKSKQASSLPQPPLWHFAGPALQRAKNLWRSLHNRGIRLNSITYNSLLHALAKGGDLICCFQALDSMMGAGGLSDPLTPSHLLPKHPDCSIAPPPFRPDEYTLTAVLTAIAMACRSRMISSTESFSLTLQMWHVLVGRLGRRLSQHHFVLLAGILGSTDRPHSLKALLPPSEQLSRGLIEIVPHRLPRLPIRSHLSQKRLSASARRAAQLLAATSQAAVPSTPSLSEAELITPPEDQLITNFLHTPESPATQMDWTNKALSLSSQINLLQPLPEGGVKVALPFNMDGSRGKSLMPWQRLALVGGLNGFLDFMTEKVHTSSFVPHLFTKLVSLLPPASLSDSSTSLSKTKLDVYEAALFQLMSKHSVKPDLPIFNALILRRSLANQPIKLLLALLSQHALSPDEVTWSCIARGCKDVSSVKSLLTSYSAAARRGSVATGLLSAKANSSEALNTMPANVRPSLHVYACLLSASAFNWDAKAAVLRSMMGSQHSVAHGLEARQEIEAVSPNRLIITTLEMEIAKFREIILNDIIPSDESGVHASAATGGIPVPPHARPAFRRFIGIYKRWLKVSKLSSSSCA